MKAVQDQRSGRKLEICDNCYTEDQEKKIKQFGYGYSDASGNKCQVAGCGAIDDHRPSSPMFRNHLFSLNEAASEVGSAQGVADTAIATGKLVGKTVANVGVIAGKLGWLFLKETAKNAEKNADQIEKDKEKEIRDLVQKGHLAEAQALRDKLDEFKARRREREARSQRGNN